MRLTIASALLLSACTAPDWCHINRQDVQDCIEARKLDPDVECRCEARESDSTPVKPVLPPPPPPPPPTGCDGGHDQNCDGIGGDPVKGGGK